MAHVDRWIRSKHYGLFERLDRTLACLHPLQQTQTGSERASLSDASAYASVSDGSAYSTIGLLGGGRRVSSSSVGQTSTLQRPTSIIHVCIYVHAYMFK